MLYLCVCTAYLREYYSHDDARAEPEFSFGGRFHGTVEMSTRPGKDQARIRATSFADPNAAKSSGSLPGGAVRVTRKWTDYLIASCPPVL